MQEPVAQGGVFTPAGLLALPICDFALWKGNAPEITLLFYAFVVSARVRAMEKAKGKKFFWFSSIARVLMLCYGGSTMIPIMLGSPPAAFMNDAVISITLVSWWLCNCCPGDIFYSTYTSSKLLRGISGFFFEIARCNVCLIWLKKGHAVIPAGGKYYPIPIWGPLLAGTFAGSFGGFVHNGLAAVDSEVTWLVQSAAYVTAAYHFAVFDPNLAPLIQGLAAPFVGPVAMGSAAWTAAWAPLVGAGCALWLAGVAFLQEAVYDKDFNPFSPIHKIAYKVTLVENQKEAAKKKKA